MLSGILKDKKATKQKQQFFTFFHIFAHFLQTLDLHNFANFYWILLKFGMQISLIALNFFHFQCCYQLSKAKKLLGKNQFFCIFFTFKGA